MPGLTIFTSLNLFALWKLFTIISLGHLAICILLTFFAWNQAQSEMFLDRGYYLFFLGWIEIKIVFIPFLLKIIFVFIIFLLLIILTIVNQ
jgi:hypothetical protein